MKRKGPMPLAEVFSVDPTRLDEASGGWVKELSDGRWKVRCIGQHCGVTNRNNRRYPAESTWGRHTLPESAFTKRVKARRVIGQVEHPQDGRSNMGAAAVVITKVEPPRASDGKVFIEFETMATPGGEIIEGFLKSNVGFGLSSRGNGTVVRADDGVDEVQGDFEPVTFDCVADESTPGAEVAARAIRESLDRMVKDAGSVEEAMRRDRGRAMEALVESGLMEKKYSDKSQEYISKKISVLKDEHPDWPHERRVAAALSMAREKGYDVPKNPNESLVSMADEDGVAEPEGEAPERHEPSGPPLGGDWILGTEDESGHYRIHETGPSSFDVWFYPSAGVPVQVADGLRTKSAARDAAEAHLHNVVGEANMQEGYRFLDVGRGDYGKAYQPSNRDDRDEMASALETEVALASTPKEKFHAMDQVSFALAAKMIRPNDGARLLRMLKEQAQVQSALPFAGTTVALRFDTGDDAAKAKKALDKAGFQFSDKGGTGIEVSTEYGDGDAAVGHIRRVLMGAEIELDTRGPAESRTMSEGLTDIVRDIRDMSIPTNIQHMLIARAEMLHDPRPRAQQGAADAFMLLWSGTGAREREMYWRYAQDLGLEESRRWVSEMSDDEMMDDDEMMGDEYLDYEDDEDDEYMCRGPHEASGATSGPMMVSGSPTMPDDLEAEDEYGGWESAMGEDYETGMQRKDDILPGKPSAKAKTTDAAAPQRKNTGVMMGGSAEMEKKGNGNAGERSAKEGGSALPKKGKGMSNPQKAARMAETIITRALPDLERAWKRGDGRKAAKIAGFIREATKTAMRGLASRATVERVRYLQSEVARLEEENEHLRALTEAMAEVQRTEMLEFERKSILKDHPELTKMEHRLSRCDTVEEMQTEAKALLAFRGVGEDTYDGSVNESVDGTQSAAPRGDEPTPSFRKRREGDVGGGASVSSALVEDAPTDSLTRATVAPANSVVESRTVGDTAARVAAYRRRRRRGGQ